MKYTKGLQIRKWVLVTLVLYWGLYPSLLSCAPQRNSSTLQVDGTLNRYEYASVHMGSRCRIVLYAKSESNAALAAKKAFESISELDDTLSDYRSDSESMRATALPPNQWINLSPLLSRVLEKSKELYVLSEGAFDPTVGAYTHLWRSTKKENRIPTRQELNRANEAVGFSKIELDTPNNQVRFAQPNMILDFGAIGKGFAADRALETLRVHGIHSALVDVGGDLTLGAAPPGNPEGWRVSIQTGVEQGWTTRLHSIAIATSGDQERHFLHNGKRYSHIIDPQTGYGIINQSSVTVIADDGATADAAASIVTVRGQAGIEQLKSHYLNIKIYINEHQVMYSDAGLEIWP